MQAQLVTPGTTYRDSFLAALREFHAENRNLHLDYNSLSSDFPAFVQTLTQGQKQPRAGKVPESILWLIVENEFVGRVSVRHKLNGNLLQFGGHIGYEIRPSWRKRGYGKEILRLGLIKAQAVGIQRVLVTCDETNTASAKIIEANGGKLENIIVLPNYPVPVRRYWIAIPQ